MVPMPDYDAMKEILGKTIKGVIVKINLQHSRPAIAVHLVFTDGTSYEIYSLSSLEFVRGLRRWSMEDARKYLNPPMENVLDVSIDDAQP